MLQSICFVLSLLRHCWCDVGFKNESGLPANFSGCTLQMEDAFTVNCTRADTEIIGPTVDAAFDVIIYQINLT